jgi:hypothetical protein
VDRGEQFDEIDLGGGHLVQANGTIAAAEQFAEEVGEAFGADELEIIVHGPPDAVRGPDGTWHKVAVRRRFAMTYAKTITRQELLDP